MNDKEKADVLVESLSWVNQFSGKIIVIKYGGNAMINEELQHSVLQDILIMKSVGMIPVVVHGGGPFISSMLDDLSMESKFEDGLRVSDEETTDVVEMVLNGQVNSNIVRQFNIMGGRAIGLSGLDDDLLKVSQLDEILGYVGKIESVNTELIEQLLELDYLPVISSVGIGPDGHSYNINADQAASAIATALGASKVIFLTNTIGVMTDQNDQSTLISELSQTKAHELIDEGIISKGMIPKIEFCMNAVNSGVDRAHIIDGRLPHSLLLELFFDMGIGTMMVREEE